MRFIDTMDIYATSGTKVRYTDSGGYDIQRENARKLGLKKGDILTVKYTDVHSSSTSVYFKEYPGHGFNSVMFEDVPEPHQRCVFEHGDDPSISGDAYCRMCHEKFHYDLVKERGFYRDAKDVLRLECPACLARNE